MEELTNIQVIVMEDEDGKETEYQIADEFDYEGRHVIALCPPENAAEDEDEVTFFFCEGTEEEFEMTPVEDKVTIEALANILEERLLARG